MFKGNWPNLVRKKLYISNFAPVGNKLISRRQVSHTFIILNKTGRKTVIMLQIIFITLPFVVRLKLTKHMGPFVSKAFK
jgi:hypothetical protein